MVTDSDNNNAGSAVAVAQGSKAERDRDVHASGKHRGRGVLRPSVADARVGVGRDEDAGIHGSCAAGFEKS